MSYNALALSQILFVVRVVPVVTEYPMLEFVKDSKLEACLVWCPRADALAMFVPNRAVKDGSCLSLRHWCYWSIKE
ncbi:hypothetical protein BD311DRAFT_782218 [Dichomitus squalens]|uniref:Uncharacterized protein n=1 Tax=Dichomitus squalens TaxID=114155 RepID=A0A4Q9M9J7_9APHY|nr:hypothetical protein BD311DRAFT_782218 [Dichomitus squalens]